jgi:hypothetical protein
VWGVCAEGGCDRWGLRWGWVGGNGGGGGGVGKGGGREREKGGRGEMV